MDKFIFGGIENTAYIPHRDICERSLEAINIFLHIKTASDKQDYQDDSTLAQDAGVSEAVHQVCIGLFFDDVINPNIQKQLIEKFKIFNQTWGGENLKDENLDSVIDRWYRSTNAMLVELILNTVDSKIVEIESEPDINQSVTTQKFILAYNHFKKVVSTLNNFSYL